MTALDDYVAKVRALVASLANHLSNPEREEVEHLIEHDEVGEALRALAWIIVEEDKRVPRTAIVAIRELSAGLVEPKDLPPSLDQHQAVDT